MTATDVAYPFQSLNGPKEAQAKNVTLSVPEMNCAGCMSTVESTLNSLNGVSGARVNLTLRRVSATSELAPEELVEALDLVGFQAFAFDNQVPVQGDDVGRDLLLRLGIAGFAMMNVMLLSVAVWSGAENATRDLMHLISASIALPVVVFSAKPFFKKAWSALRMRRLNMDVPISLAIVLAAGMSLYEALHGGRHAYFDAALALTFFLLIGRYLEHRTKQSARSAAQDLAALESHTAERWDGTGLQTVHMSEIVVGDRLYIPSGARIPVDGQLETNSAWTNRAFITGESEPVESAANALLSAGEINVGAPFTIVARAVGEDTTLRQIARLVEQAENVRNRYTALADRAAKIYAPAVHLLAFLAFLGWLAGTGDVRLSLNIAIAVLIITCPCALGLAVPAVATAAIAKLYRLGFFVKSGVALERLAETDTVVFDKTGTLTDPEPVLDFSALDERERSIAAALAQASSHPIALSMRHSLEGTAPAKLTGVEEQSGKGITARAGETSVGLGQAQMLGADGSGTVLRIGPKRLPISFSDCLRPGAAVAVRELKSQGLAVELLSGDTEAKALALASQLGIEDVRAQMSPREKQTVLEDHASYGRRVCMIGDGLNDTVAMATAHASVAPGSALDAARSAADIVLARDSLADLPELFRTARKASLLSKQNFSIATLYNLIAIPVALLGHATPLLAALAMSLSSLTVLINALRARV